MIDSLSKKIGSYYTKKRIHQLESQELESRAEVETSKTGDIVFAITSTALTIGLFAGAVIGVDKSLEERHQKNPSAFLKKAPDDKIGASSSFFRDKVAAMLHS